MSQNKYKEPSGYDIWEKEEKRRRKLYYTQLAVAAFTIVTAFATILMAWATIDTAKSTEKLVNQERQFNAPVLSFWQATFIKPYVEDMISPQEVRHRVMRFCVRNDGRTSTGMVSVFPSYNDNFTFYSERISDSQTHTPVYENIPSGEGNCTDIFVWYKPCMDYGSCNSSLVPTGNQSINVIITCALCNENQRVKYSDLKICITPSDECDRIIL